MKTASRIFRGAAIYGALVLLPQFALEGWIGRDAPPAITHPEFFYGFLGVALAWQAAFFVIARDPIRFRPLMLPAILEKLAFGLAGSILVLAHRADPRLLAFAGIDLLLAGLFLRAYRLTRA